MSDELKEQLKQLALNPRLWVALVGILVTTFQLQLEPETTGLLVAIIVATFLGVEKASTGMAAAAKLTTIISDELAQQKAAKPPDQPTTTRSLFVAPTDFGLGSEDDLKDLVRQIVREELGGKGVDHPDS